MTPEEESRGVASGRRRWPWIALVLAVVGGVTAAATRASWMPSESTTSDTAAIHTASVIRGDLSLEESYGGTLEALEGETIPSPAQGVISYVPSEGSVVEAGQVLFAVDGEPVIVLAGTVPAYRDLTLGAEVRQLASRSNGTVTWLAPVGSVLGEGDVVAAVDGQPVVLLTGEVPMYRRLFDARTNLEGDDVLQLEDALTRLGFNADGAMAVDGEFTAATADVVEAWQESTGMTVDGAVDLGEVMFLPGPVQVTATLTDVASRVNDGSPLLQAATGDALAGGDVLQLEEALRSLGYLDSADDVFDSATADAIKALQAADGGTPTGFLAAASVLFSDLSVRVDAVIAGIGSAVSPNSPVLAVASTDLIVRVDLPASDQGVLVEGQVVTVELPNADEIGGIIASIATTATRQPGQEATFEVVVVLDDPVLAAGFVDSPVDVKVVTDSVENVLAVPVTALLALAEGGYAVEVVDGASTRLVAVDPGLFARGMVEVTGNVSEGDLVVVP